MKHHVGSIEVVTGSMFSGKTDELIRRLRRATIARQKVQVLSRSLTIDTMSIRSLPMPARSSMPSQSNALPISGRL